LILSSLTGTENTNPALTKAAHVFYGISNGIMLFMVMCFLLKRQVPSLFEAVIGKWCLFFYLAFLMCHIFIKLYFFYKLVKFKGGKCLYAFCSTLLVIIFCGYGIICCLDGDERFMSLCVSGPDSGSGCKGFENAFRIKPNDSVSDLYYWNLDAFIYYENSKNEFGT